MLLRYKDFGINSEPKKKKKFGCQVAGGPWKWEPQLILIYISLTIENETRGKNLSHFFDFPDQSERRIFFLNSFGFLADINLGSAFSKLTIWTTRCQLRVIFSWFFKNDHNLGWPNFGSFMLFYMKTSHNY